MISLFLLFLLYFSFLFREGELQIRNKLQTFEIYNANQLPAFYMVGTLNLTMLIRNLFHSILNLFFMSSIVVRNFSSVKSMKPKFLPSGILCK